jgi:pilus assembly protein FimV
MYAPGGRPSAALVGGAGAVVEPLGSSTMPQSVLPPMSNYTLSDAEERGAPSSLDLDLDLVAPPTMPMSPLETTQPLNGSGEGEAVLELPAVPGIPPAAGKPDESGASAGFRVGGISLDLGTPAGAGASEPALDFSAMGAADKGAAEPALDSADPLVRKLELAEEFRQIGDMEGARDLLEEVVSKANGPLKSRAQSLLDSLG